MANEYIKKIKIDVDDSKLKQAKKALEEFEKTIARQDELDKRRAGLNKKQLKAVNEQIAAEERLLKLTEKQNAVEKARLDLLDKQKRARLINNDNEKNRANENRVMSGLNTFDQIQSLRKGGVAGFLKNSISENFNTVNSNQTRINEIYNTAKLTKAGKVDMRTAAGKELAGLQAGSSAAMGAASAAAPILLAIQIAMEVAKFIQKVCKEINHVFKEVLGISLSLKDNFNEILNTAGQMAKTMVGYNTSSGLITNSAARTTQMKYGLTSAQNYGMQSAMSMLGMSSDEDLMYMNSSQRSVFLNLMQKYASWYEELESSGVLESIQELQIEFAMFKQELAVSLLQWFGENKDAIFGIIKAILNVTRIIANAVIGVHNVMPWNWFGGQLDYISGFSDLTSSSSTSTTSSKNVNVSMNVNATGVLGSEIEMQNFFNEQTEKLAQTISVQLGD